VRFIHPGLIWSGTNPFVLPGLIEAQGQHVAARCSKTIPRLKEAHRPNSANFLFFLRLQQPLVQMILDYDDVKGNIWWQNGQRCQPQQVSNQAIKF
jgi:hypothetical protein